MHNHKSEPLSGGHPSSDLSQSNPHDQVIHHAENKDLGWISNFHWSMLPLKTQSPRLPHYPNFLAKTRRQGGFVHVSRRQGRIERFSRELLPFDATPDFPTIAKYPWRGFTCPRALRLPSLGDPASWCLLQRTGTVIRKWFFLSIPITTSSPSHVRVMSTYQRGRGLSESLSRVCHPRLRIPTTLSIRLRLGAYSVPLRYLSSVMHCPLACTDRVQTPPGEWPAASF